jgi:hypothetical protein
MSCGGNRRSGRPAVALVCGDPQSDGGVAGARQITEAFHGTASQNISFATMTKHLASRSRLASGRWGSEPTHIVPIVLAERIRRTLDWLDPTRVHLPFAGVHLSTFGESLPNTRAIIMRCEPTLRLGRTRPVDVRSSGSGTLSPSDPRLPTPSIRSNIVFGSDRSVHGFLNAVRNEEPAMVACETLFPSLGTANHRITSFACRPA